MPAEKIAFHSLREDPDLWERLIGEENKARDWETCQNPMSDWPERKKSNWLTKWTGRREIADYWARNFDGVYENRIDSWDYQLIFSCWSKGMLSVLPGTNLVSNIGFGEGATHTVSSDSLLARIPARAATLPLRHPRRMRPNRKADLHTAWHIFGVQRLPRLDSARTWMETVLQSIAPAKKKKHSVTRPGNKNKSSAAPGASESGPIPVEAHLPGNQLESDLVTVKLPTRFSRQHMSLLTAIRRWLPCSKPVISLLHATRQRADRALNCRRLWLEAAENPDRVEHVFAIDSDDLESAAELAGCTVHTVTQAGLGCVGAWNLAAQHSTGDILVQLSDDWLPVAGWDRIFAERLAPTRKPKVLRISDGHRNDDLLCMAIITRARLRQQGWFLPPAYTGVYSDDEFSYRAFEDGVVVEARDIVLVHEHPNYDTAIAMDETYRQQNDESKYAGAKGIFLKRNPEAKKRWFVQGDWSARKWLPPGSVPVKNKSKS